VRRGPAAGAGPPASSWPYHVALRGPGSSAIYESCRGRTTKVDDRLRPLRVRTCLADKQPEEVARLCFDAHVPGNGSYRIERPQVRTKNDRPHAATTPSADSCVLCLERRNCSNSCAGSGLLNRKPCISVQPSDFIACSCSSVSTPSAVAATPSPFANAATARTMFSELALSTMLLMNERSILILSNGNLCR
jgi:hypothetical protein